MDLILGFLISIPVLLSARRRPGQSEAILYGMMQLQRKVKVEQFFGTTNRKQKQPKED